MATAMSAETLVFFSTFDVAHIRKLKLYTEVAEIQRQEQKFILARRLQEIRPKKKNKNCSGFESQ
jgi:hypothetical protein